MYCLSPGLFVAQNMRAVWAAIPLWFLLESSLPGRAPQELTPLVYIIAATTAFGWCDIAGQVLVRGKCRSSKLLTCIVYLQGSL
jgi:hypothetical protein